MQEFVKGYSYSDHFAENTKNPPKFGQLPLVTDDYSWRAKSVTLEDVINEVQKHLPKNYSDFVAKLPRAIMTELDAIEVASPDIKVPEFETMLPNYKEYRITSRFWADIGRLMLQENKENPAFAISAGILLIAHKLDRHPDSGPLLISRMIGMAIRNIGNSLLLEHANKTNLSAKQLKTWIPKFQKLRQGILPISDAYKVEAKFYEVAGKFLSSKGFFSGTMLLYNKKEFEKMNDKIINRYIECDKFPYSKKIGIYHEVNTYLESLHYIDGIPTSVIVNGIIAPSEMVAQRFAATFTPNFRTAYKNEAKMLQLADGAITALIIKAYAAEKNAFPDSLQQVEDWYGEKLPLDIFADMAPLQFNKSGKKQLFSIGPDMEANTEDDLVFMSLSQ